VTLIFLGRGLEVVFAAIDRCRGDWPIIGSKALCFNSASYPTARRINALTSYDLSVSLLRICVIIEVRTEEFLEQAINLWCRNLCWIRLILVLVQYEIHLVEGSLCQGESLDSGYSLEDPTGEEQQSMDEHLECPYSLFHRN
jgi:hypothetical protein